MPRPLLAEDVSLAFQNWLRWSTGNGLWLTTLTLLVLLWAGLYAWGRMRSSSSGVSFGDPESLFRELCQLHRLGGRDQEILSQLAKQHSAAQPALVFVDPRILSAAEDENAPRLRAKLFGDATTS
jgi:hypothetical protein